MRAAIFILLVAAAATVTGSLAMKQPPEAVPPMRIASDVLIGEAVDPAQVHIIERPGLYGLGECPPGSDYAVVRSTLVRIDPKDMVVQSIIRPAVHPID